MLFDVAVGERETVALRVALRVAVVVCVLVRDPVADRVLLRVTLCVALRLLDAVGVWLGVRVGDAGVAVEVRAGLADVIDAVLDAVTDDDGVLRLDDEELIVREPETVIDGEQVTLPEPDGDGDSEPVSLQESDKDGDGVPVTLRGTLRVGLCDLVDAALMLRVAVAVPVDDGVVPAVLDGVDPAVLEGVVPEVLDGVPEVLLEGVAVGDAITDTVGAPVVEPVGGGDVVPAGAPVVEPVGGGDVVPVLEVEAVLVGVPDGAKKVVLLLAGLSRSSSTVAYWKARVHVLPTRTAAPSGAPSGMLSCGYQPVGAAQLDGDEGHCIAPAVGLWARVGRHFTTRAIAPPALTHVSSSSP